METFKRGRKPDILTPRFGTESRAQQEVKVRLDPGLKKSLDHAAEQRGMSRNLLVNTILAEHLAFDLNKD